MGKNRIELKALKLNSKTDDMSKFVLILDAETVISQETMTLSNSIIVKVIELERKKNNSLFAFLNGSHAVILKDIFITKSFKKSFTIEVFKDDKQKTFIFKDDEESEITFHSTLEESLELF